METHERYIGFKKINCAHCFVCAFCRWGYEEKSDAYWTECRHPQGVEDPSVYCPTGKLISRKDWIASRVNVDQEASTANRIANRITGELTA